MGKVKNFQVMVEVKGKKPHISKSSPNQNVHLNPIKTEKREAYQSSTVRLFSCFWTNSLKKCKNHYLFVKSWFFCNQNVIITSRIKKFGGKKTLHPLPPKIAVFADKSQKNYIFPTLGQK